MRARGGPARREPRRRPRESEEVFNTHHLGSSGLVGSLDSVEARSDLCRDPRVSAHCSNRTVLARSHQVCPSRAARAGPRHETKRLSSPRVPRPPATARGACTARLTGPRPQEHRAGLSFVVRGRRVEDPSPPCTPRGRARLGMRCVEALVPRPPRPHLRARSAPRAGPRAASRPPRRPRRFPRRPLDGFPTICATR